MQELKALATYAAQNAIRGTSSKRNSLLKPLDIILDELERCPTPADPNELANELELVRTGSKGLIFEHLERIAKAEYKVGKTKQGKVSYYVDLFFDDVLGHAHHGKVNKLLGREKLIRSAYLVYFREAWAIALDAKGQAKEAAAVADAAELELEIAEPANEASA